MEDRCQTFERDLFCTEDSFYDSIFSNCSIHFVCLGLVTIILKIFKLCLCSSKMNNLLSPLYLHLETLLRAISSWHSKGRTKQARLWCKASHEQWQYARPQTYTDSRHRCPCSKPVVQKGWKMPLWPQKPPRPWLSKYTMTTKRDSCSQAEFHQATPEEQLWTPKGDCNSEKLRRCCSNNCTESAAGDNYGNNHCRGKSTKRQSQRNESKRESWRSIKRRSVAGPKGLPLSSCSVLCPLGTGDALSPVPPLLLIAVPVQSGNQQ